MISGASYGDVGVFTLRNFDTQFRMPSGYLPLKELDRDALVFGATYWPDRHRREIHSPASGAELEIRDRTRSTSDWDGGSNEISIVRPPCRVRQRDRRDGRAAAPQVVEISRRAVRFTPSEFRVKAGAPVEIRLRSDDTDHGFRIVGTDINVSIPKRGKGVATVTFVPPQAGKYVFECSKLCGAGHGFMRGSLIAE